MTKLIAPSFVLVVLVVLVALLAPGGAASAQPAGAAAAAGSATPPPAVAEPSPPPQPAASPPATAIPSDARKQCTAAMNADPTFAAEIVKVADEAAAAKRDAETVAAHKDANFHVQKNERHVIYAYAAMWIIAAAFVLFLWRRQQALKTEILHLRRDLEAAADDAKLAEKRP